MKTKLILIKFYEKPPSFMEGKITSNFKSNQTLLSTRDYSFVNGKLLWVVTASNCKSIYEYTTYMNICRELATALIFLLIMALRCISYVVCSIYLELSFKKISTR